MTKSRADISIAPFLNVPIEDKERAKMAGARWHAGFHRWFIPKGTDPAPFAEWAPVVETEPAFRAKAPFYVVESHEACWKCRQPAPVITLASEGMAPTESATTIGGDEGEEGLLEPMDGFLLYSYVEYVPLRLSAFLRQRYGAYYVDYSKTTDSYYWMNHCTCGAPLGDFFMHSEPEGAFFPMSESRAKAIRLILLKPNGYIALCASYGSGPADLIPTHASRETVQP